MAALTVSACGSTPASTTASQAPAASSVEQDLTPVLTIKELMEHIIDPTADWIFDAAVVDVSAAGTVETKPVTDEEWLKVERGVLILAEGSNLLKMPRAVAPAGTEAVKGAPGQPAPELAPAEIQAKIDGNRALWNKYSDHLRDEVLASLESVKARSLEGLFEAGTRIDNACEACHLEYWYPGDKAAVEAFQDMRVTYDPPKKK